MKLGIFISYLPVWNKFNPCRRKSCISVHSAVKFCLKKGQFRNCNALWPGTFQSTLWKLIEQGLGWGNMLVAIQMRSWSELRVLEMEQVASNARCLLVIDMVWQIEMSPQRGCGGTVLVEEHLVTVTEDAVYYFTPDGSKGLSLLALVLEGEDPGWWDNCLDMRKCDGCTNWWCEAKNQRGS